ncbi:uroporphyrinogen-III synthase [Paenibacillus taiwanensis]|uniref:uroporphyrinogen-III synthase n=1 Tax=Paenibacillus taiwanensis TaxID=401638 RepID=UPI0004266F3A|nr:uroporphyrinogen-III synthase [Paenibacillus taiwanensis]
MAKLEGKVVALTGPRKAEEMSALVRKQGGTPLIRATQGTLLAGFDHLDNEVDKLLNQNPPMDWAVWTTGMGLNMLIEAAVDAEKRELLLQQFAGMKHAARGYKTINALRKLGITPDVRDDDGSTLGLVRGMQSQGIEAWSGKHVSLQLHGDPAPTLVSFLKEAGASWTELMPYRHTPPAEQELALFVQELLSGKIDAVAMTSAPQARFLFQYAHKHGLAAELRRIFAERTLAAAVGKVTAAALQDEGVSRVLVPEEERMGVLIVKLSHWYDEKLV